MAGKKKEQLAEGAINTVARIPLKHHAVLVEIKKEKIVQSINDALIEALTYWFVNKLGYKLEEEK